MTNWTSMRVAPVTGDEILTLWQREDVADRALTAGDIAFYLHLARGGRANDFQPQTKMDAAYRPPVRDSHVKPVLATLIEQGSVVSAKGVRAGRAIGNLTGITVQREACTYYAVAANARRRGAELDAAREQAELTAASAARARVALAGRVSGVVAEPSGLVTLRMTRDQVAALVAALGGEGVPDARGTTSGTQALIG